MELVYKAVLFFLFISVTVCSELNYKAAVVTGTFRNDLTDFLPKIAEASKQGADITLLSTEVPVSEICSDSACGLENYDGLLRSISDAAKKYSVYIVTHLYEKIRCQGNDVIVTSSLVYDRKGSVLTAYRKPLNNDAVCNTTGNDLISFTTDFGVNFLLLMNDDLVSRDIEDLKMAKNLIITGGSYADTAYLRENQLIGSLAYTSNVNIISNSGIFVGKSGFKNDALVQILDKDNIVTSNRISLGSLDTRSQSIEDLSQYNITPLDMQASSQGYTKTVCHEKLCCEFYVKKTTMDLKTNDLHYGLAVFEGIREVGDHFVATESCKMVVCTKLDRGNCEHNLEDHNIVFDKVTITGNFTKRHSAQFPVILTAETSMSSDSFVFVAKPMDDVKQVTAELSDAKNIIKFGILGRDYSRDFNRFSNNTNTEFHSTSDYYDCIFNKEVVEFFDSLWIKLRILLFIVSVYILEMM